MQGRHVRPVASPHCLSIFLWASEPLRCDTCAQSLLWHFLLIHFSQIFSLYTSQVCFYPCRAFDLLPECSLPCPGRFRPGWPLAIFSREHFISTSLFFCTKRHDGCVWLLRWPRPITFIVFSGTYFPAITVKQMRPLSVTVSPGSLKSLPSCTKIYVTS